VAERSFTTADQVESYTYSKVYERSLVSNFRDSVIVSSNKLCETTFSLLYQTPSHSTGLHNLLLCFCVCVFATVLLL